MRDERERDGKGTYEPPTNAPVKTLKKNDMLSQSLRECMKRRREREREVRCRLPK